MNARGFALVTGASQGLGKSFARTLAARSHNVALAARSKDKLEQFAEELRAAHDVSVAAFVCDLSLPSAAQHLVEQINARGLSINLLVNNAGFGLRGEFRALPLERQLEMIRLHCEAATELTYLLLPPMLERKRGGVINVSSVAGLQPVPFAALYSATKAFLTNFSLSLAEELRPHNIAVVTLCPGRLRSDERPTPKQDRKFWDVQQDYGEVIEEALKSLKTGGGLVTPGAANKFALFAQRFIPRQAIPKIVSKLSRS